MSGDLKELKHNQKPVVLWKNYNPERIISFRSISPDPFSFVEFCIKQKKLNEESKKEALSYWTQAKNLYVASKEISVKTKPLTSYYSILNATKTLLTVNQIDFVPRHGFFSNKKSASKIDDAKINFSNENDIGFNLCKLLKKDESFNSFSKYSLKKLFYNIPFSHRAFLQTFEDFNDLFLPVEGPRFFIEDEKIVLRAKAKFDNLTKIVSAESFLPSNDKFKFCEVSDEVYIVSSSICSSNNYETDIVKNYWKNRNHFEYIEGNKTLWYFKNNISNNENLITLPLPTIIHMVSFYFSELCRYYPKKLENLLNDKCGWMVNDFINDMLDQFISFITCEITGKELSSPRIR